MPMLCCILFQFYIKPQLNYYVIIRFTVVFYFNSTSNHNIRLMTPIS